MINKNKLLEIVVAVPAMFGSFLIASTDSRTQTIGFFLFLITNISGAFFTGKKKFYILMLQYLIFTFATFKALGNRLIW